MRHTLFRTAAAAALSLALLCGSAAAYQSEPAPWAAPEVRAAWQLGLASGALFGDYDRPATRAEFCRFACGFLEAATGESPDALAAALFPSGYDKQPFPDTSLPEAAFLAAAGVIGLFIPPVADFFALHIPQGGALVALMVALLASVAIFVLCQLASRVFARIFSHNRQTRQS